MKGLLFFLIILMVGVVRADDRITTNEIVVVIVNKDKCNLSRQVEQTLSDSSVRTNLEKMHQQLFIYNGQDNLKYSRAMGVKWFPSMFRLRKINNQWYKVDTFDPTKTKVTPTNVLRFLRLRVRNTVPSLNPGYTPPNYTQNCVPGGS